MMNLRSRLGLVFGLVLLMVAGWGNTVFAHGGTGTPQLNNEDIGPYRIFVWSDPEPPQVGEYHVAVALTESLPGDASGFAGQPILGADVTVTLTHIAGGEVMTGKATHQDAINKIYYESQFEVSTPGEWRIDLTVDGPDGTASATYVDEILPASLNWMPIAGGALAVLLVGSAFVFHWRVQPQAVEAHG